MASGHKRTSYRCRVMDSVWIVTKWIWGGGGDDDREIVAVHTSQAGATERASRDSGLDIKEHEVTRP